MNSNLTHLYRATAKFDLVRNGISIPKGLSVDFVYRGLIPPQFMDDGLQAIEAAYQRIYGISIKAADVLSPVYIKVEKIS